MAEEEYRARMLFVPARPPRKLDTIRCFEIEINRFVQPVRLTEPMFPLCCANFTSFANILGERQRKGERKGGRFAILKSNLLATKRTVLRVYHSYKILLSHRFFEARILSCPPSDTG